jgi:hypothetical protein
MKGSYNYNNLTCHISSTVYLMTSSYLNISRRKLLKDIPRWTIRLTWEDKLLWSCNDDGDNDDDGSNDYDVDVSNN